MNLSERSYDIVVGRNLLSRADEYFNLRRKVFIVTDAGVPKDYAERVASLSQESKIVCVPSGEDSKSPEVYTSLLSEMINFGMTRSDCAVAVGGGVVGDLTGFVAASYMRGIDFYNIPTTVLSQVDSSIGGKVAINLSGIKNIVGAFHQPKGVIVDPDLLKTLPSRQIANGLSEAVKMALTSDADLFEMIEKDGVNEGNIEEVILRSLKIKKAVVEADEHEGGLRKILNFGHTLGHAIEAEEELKGYYHGECVALGMTAVCSDEVNARLMPVLSGLGLPTLYSGNLESALSYISHDKKCSGDSVSVIWVEEIGSFKIIKMSVKDFCDLVIKRLGV
jgi:3-dehydroquinate synthase